MPRRNNRKRSRRNSLPIGNGTGPTRTPATTLTKRFQYLETIALDNATSTYAYRGEFMRPDITKAIGSDKQFGAYELWRLKRIKVSIQLAGTQENDQSQRLLNAVANTTIWTAADLGSNEDAIGAAIMQYQNVKRNTLDLNKWTRIVNTAANINTSLVIDGGGTSTYSFVLPRSTWINTTEFNSKMYSGYQLFIQNFAALGLTPTKQLAFQLSTELYVEFKQPAWQNVPSTFERNFLTHGLRVMLASGDTNFTTLSPKETKLSSEGLIVTFTHNGIDYPFTPAELKHVINTNTGGARFQNRVAEYDGMVPPTLPFVRTPPHTLIGTTFTVPSIPRDYEIVSSSSSTVDAQWGNNNIDTVAMSDIAPRISTGVYTNWSGPVVKGW